MLSFVVKRKKEWFNLDEPILKDIGYKYNPKINKEKYLEIKDLYICKPEIISCLIINNFDKKYKKILEVYIGALEDDDESTEGTLIQALNEIARLRTIIINKFNRVLKKKEMENLLKKLKFLENEIRIKVTQYKIIDGQKLDEEKGMAR